MNLFIKMACDAYSGTIVTSADQFTVSIHACAGCDISPTLSFNLHQLYHNN